MGKSTRNLVFTAVLLIVLMGMGTGCAKSGTSLTTSPVTYVSFINEASYTAPVNILLNDTPATINGGIAAGGFSLRYGTIRPGNYAVKFATTTTDSVVSEIPASAYDTLNFYTLVLYNPAPNGPASSVKIWDDFSTISTSQSNYRFFNLSPDYPNVDLYLNGTKTQGSRTPADNVNNTLLNSFLPVSTGSYTIAVKVAGTDSVIVSKSDVELGTGDVYTIFLSGNKNSTTYPLTANVLQAQY